MPNRVYIDCMLEYESKAVRDITWKYIRVLKRLLPEDNGLYIGSKRYLFDFYARRKEGNKLRLRGWVGRGFFGDELFAFIDWLQEIGNNRDEPRVIDIAYGVEDKHCRGGGFFAEKDKPSVALHKYRKPGGGMALECIYKKEG